ncbi:MAG: DUF2157 domain-containing protein, partial [Candidatus Brocadiales bacterium]|nr:DUF2157 domain-containing protein [Candidatus Brocadiales bacterium]
MDLKLRKWVEEGLITESARVQILNYEKEHKTSYVLGSIIGIGSLSITVGAVATITSNWKLIPDIYKLIFNFTWVLSLFVAAYYTHVKKFLVIKEILILLIFGSILGSIILVNQIYNLELHPFISVSWWLGITLPIIIFAKTEYIAFIWSMSIIVLYILLVLFLIEESITSSAYKIIGLLPLLLIYISEIFKIFPSKVNFYSVISFLGWLVFGITMSALGTIRWTGWEPFTSSLAPIAIMSAAIPLIAINIRRKLFSIALLITLGVLFAEVANTFEHGNLKVAGGIFFIIVWGVAAFTGVKIKDKFMFDLSCMVIATRMIIIYFEKYKT